MNTSVNKLVKLSMLSALGVLFMMVIRFPIIPTAPFLVYEPGDIPALIAAFIFGPSAGLFVTAIISGIQATGFSGDGWVGGLMHFVATGTMVIVSGYIYKKIHNLKGAVISLVVGSLSMTLIMIPLNLLITPLFYGIPVSAVTSMLIPAIIPFNIIKAGLNSILTVMVYKSVARLLKAEIRKASKEI